jgi:hypothetical protein
MLINSTRTRWRTWKLNKKIVCGLLECYIIKR